MVDDEEDFREILSERMASRGLEIDTAESGMRALEMVELKTYDAIILDLAIPEMDGIETLQRLLKKQPSLQIIVLTGQATVEKGVAAVKMGAADFLEKPAEIESLVEKIEAAQAKRMEIFEQNLDKKITEITRKRSW